MAQHGPLPYLSVNGVEIANAARTVDYIRNGLGPPGKFEFNDAQLCGVLYRVNGGTCGSPDVYTSPSIDPAPWWDPGDDASESFLGLIMVDIDPVSYGSVKTRTVSGRLGGLQGGVFTGPRRKPRDWKFKAGMICADDAGAEYGLRWLKHALSSSACAACLTTDLSVYLACPPADCSDDSRGKWSSFEVALTDGPRETVPRAPGSPPGILAGCRDVVIVEWTMTAGNPYLYRDAIICLQAETLGANLDCNSFAICDWLFGDPGTPHCCQVDPPTIGDIGAVFTLESVSGMGEVLLEAYTECPGGTGGSGGSSGATEPVLQMRLDHVPAGSTVTVDCARQIVAVATIDPDTGDTVVQDGRSLLLLPSSGRIDWIVARDCDPIFCFCARTAHPCSQGGDTTVTIATRARED